MCHLVAALAQCLRAFQGKRTTTTDHHMIDLAETAQNFLVVSNGAQSRNTRQVQARTGERTRTRSIGKQQIIIADALIIMELHKALSGVNTKHTPWHEANALIMIKSVRTCPEFRFWQIST